MGDTNTDVPTIDERTAVRSAARAIVESTLNPTRCPVRRFLETVANRWSIMLLLVLSERSYRYGELRRKLSGISQRMLTKTLQDLEVDGFINRAVIATKPPSTEYSITALGIDLLDPVGKLIVWGHDNQSRLAPGPEKRSLPQALLSAAMRRSDVNR